MRKIVIHYDEIALKGKNRAYFEDKLLSNLKVKFKQCSLRASFEKSWGRIFIKLADESDYEKAKGILAFSPGLSNFGFAHVVPKKWNEALKLAGVFADAVAGKKFRVSAKRVDKSFDIFSQDAERLFANEMFKADSSLSVSLKNFDIEVQIEILHKEILLYVKEKGIGGLPVGTSGAAVSLLSAGFDSPVASFMLLKRGVSVHPLHFHSMPKAGADAVASCKKIAKRLFDFAPKMSLALVGVLPIQRHIALNAPDKLQIVLLRRSMMRIANAYAENLGALAIVSGESVGQVASQTLENILSVNDAANLPVLRPLAGFNKNEIISLAREIGTHEISEKQCEDTCSLFMPEHPETKSKLPEILKIEKNMNLGELEKEAFEKMEILCERDF